MYLLSLSPSGGDREGRVDLWLVLVDIFKIECLCEDIISRLNAFHGHFWLAYW